MHYAMFDTALGACGLAWNDAGVARVQLPAAEARDTRLRLARHPNFREHAPTPTITRVIALLQAYMRGEAADFGWVEVDMAEADALERQVYVAARDIPWGAAISYGELAERIGLQNGARDVGHALSRNPTAIIVPCHRIVASGGKLGGFSAPGGADTKLKLLELEGVRIGTPAGQGALF
ncbi:MAG TPA: methylated-DNA--[protein]-cysteine S-methyltransferase [Burkholderiales bacterium]|jgi:methylated-DNA-[protein]-cysteine S-methyltransferase